MSATGPDADQGDGGGDPETPPLALPEGWAIVYAAALRRAQRKESLPKLASAFWQTRGGWDKWKATEDGQTAAAIYSAFEKNFGNKDAIEAELRELV